MFQVRKRVAEEVIGVEGLHELALCVQRQMASMHAAGALLVVTNRCAPQTTETWSRRRTGRQVLVYTISALP